MIITILRKTPEGSVADNTLKHGCGSINIDDTRIGTEARSYKGSGKSNQVYTESRAGMSDGRGKEMEFKADGRWPANFTLIHKEGCELKGTKKVKSNGHFPKQQSSTPGTHGKMGGGWSGKVSPERHMGKEGNEKIADWDCVESCPIKELDRQSGISKSSGGRIGNKGGGGIYGGGKGLKGPYSKGNPGIGDTGGASRFFKQFKKGGQMKEMIEYFKTMITPPVEDACIVVASPNDLDFSAYKKFDEGALIPTYEPMVHGIILLDEPTEEQSKEIMEILKPGAHVILMPKGIGYKGVVSLEDTGFEVRDSIFVAENPDSFYYSSKASRSEREAGLKAEGDGRANLHPTVKPIDIMEWCARDIEPKSKVVDPFLGSGTTGIAMSRLGHDFVGIELNPEYAKICEARIRHWMPIGTQIESEAKVGKLETKKGEQISILDLFD